jgi:GTP-binding protein
MEIKQAIYIISSPSVDKCPKPDRPEFAFIGRSNVGKSSLINMICNNKKLAKISATPGKTQLINHFEIISSSGKERDKKWYLVDLPGYGFANRSKAIKKSWSKMIEDYIRKRENLVNLFVLVDARHEPQQLDLDFINRLGGWQVPFLLVFTKADKNKEKQTQQNVERFMVELKTTWAELPRYVITSAPEKRGREQLLEYIKSLEAT